MRCSADDASHGDDVYMTSQFCCGLRGVAAKFKKVKFSKKKYDRYLQHYGLGNVMSVSQLHRSQKKHVIEVPEWTPMRSLSVSVGRCRIVKR